MTHTAHPGFFDRFPMHRVSDAGLDALLVDDDAIRILFLWGRDCPNCDIAKGQILLSADRFRWHDVQWLHDNVYEDPSMATRFGLHGIPAFLVFRGARKLGRIGQWPGTQAFVAAIEKIRSDDAQPDRAVVDAAAGDNTPGAQPATPQSAVSGGSGNEGSGSGNRTG